MSQKFASKTYSRVRKSNGFKKRAKVYGRAGIQLYKDVKYLKGLINSEPKYHTVQSANNFSWNGLVVSLSSIPQGGGVNDRDGNMILPRYLNINLNVGSTVAGTEPTLIRFIIFRYWGESTNVAGGVTVTEVLSNTGTQFSPLCHLNDDNTGNRGDRQRRIEIHKNEVVNFDLVNYREMAYSYNIIVNGGDSPKEHIKFNSSATAEPVSGGFYILFISNNSGSLNANSKYAFESKLTFYDN